MKETLRIKRGVFLWKNDERDDIILLIYVERGENMSLYGHTYINIDSLKRWVNSLSLDGIQSVDVGGYNFEIKDETKELLNLQLNGFSDCVNRMNEDDDWRHYQGILSHAFYNAFNKCLFKLSVFFFLKDVR